MFATGAPLAAQGTAPVPLDDPAYAYLDRLEELGLVDSAVMGQRPYSYQEMGRLARATRAAAAVRATGETERALVDGLLARLETRVTPVPSVTAMLVNEGLLSATSTNAVRRNLPPAGTSSPPEATIDPLALRRLGEPAPRGRSLALELIQRAEPLSWLAVNGRERVEMGSPHEALAATVLEGGARARWRNVALMVGREQLGWGSGSRGGLFLASDAPALDQIVIASDHPFVLPSVFSRVGPFSGTIMLAEVGPSTVRSHSKMLAYKMSVRPTPALELGATVQNHFGGEGGRTSPFLTRIIDFLPMIDIFRRHNYTDSSQVLDVDSDKAIGADARWRIDRLGGVIVAGEWLVDDFDAQRLVSLFNYAGSHALSITVPRLGSPAWSLELLATHMGPLTYDHAALRQGMTTRGRLLGSELGPDAKRFGAELRWMPAAGTRLSLAGQSVVYSNSTYRAGYDAGGQWVVNKAASGTDELREQVIGTVALEPTSATGLTLRGGVERTRNVMFVGGRRRSYVADVVFRWRP